MDKRFTITFTAPGTMNGSTLTITIPDDLQPDGGFGMSLQLRTILIFGA